MIIRIIYNNIRMYELVMARQRKEFTLGNTTIEYLKNFKNASKIIDEAIELHKNKDKVVINPQNKELKVKLLA